MKGALFFYSIVAFASAKPGGYYHQEYNYKSSSSSFKNNELQHQNENEGFYSKDGDLEGRSKPKVNSHSQHSEYTNPKLLTGSSTSLGVGGYNGANNNQANFDRLFGSSNMDGYHTGGAADGYASTDRVMDLSNVYTSGTRGSSNGNYGTSLGFGANSAAGYGSNSGYRTSSAGHGTYSGGFRTSSGGISTASDGYGTNSGYGTNLGGYGRTHENYGTSRGVNYGNSLEGDSNFGYTQGGRSYGYVQHGASSGYRSSNTNLNSMVQRLQEEMSRQLQHAVNNQYRSSGYTSSVSSTQMTADIRALEDELKRNLTRQLEESLRSQYGQQELRGSDSYSVIEGRPSSVVNYRNQDLAALTGQLENNLLKQLHQNIRTTYNRESGSTYTSSNNIYQPNYYPSSTYRPAHYERHNNIRYTPVSNPESITQIASRIQSDINVYLDNALQNIYSTYLQSERNTYTITDFDNEVNRIRDQIIRNLTWNMDDQIRRNYGQQILKDNHYYSVSSSGETSSQYNYNIKDYENLRKQVEDNLLKKLNQTVNTYRDQYQRKQSYSSNTNYYTATFRPIYYTSGNQVYDYSDLQRQLSNQLQNALNKHKYSQSSSYSMSTSNNPQAYQISLDELTRELQRNLTEQLNNYRVQSSSSSYGYTSGGSASGGSTDFESMKNQLQNQLMQQLQQGLQKQYRYSASASYSASSSSSSNGNYGTHQSYGNYGNLYPNNRYKRDISFYGPREHHYSFKKSSRMYSSSGQFSSQEENGARHFPSHGHDMKPLEFDFARSPGNHFRSTFSKRTEDNAENFPETVEDVSNHHQVERPQKLYMHGGHQLEFGRPEHSWRQHPESSEFHHKFDEDQDSTGQQIEDLNQHSRNYGHYGNSRYRATNKFEVSGHMIPHQSQFPGQETGDYSIPNQDIERQHTEQSEDDFTQQLQNINSHEHFKHTPTYQLPEQQSQENLDQNLELEDLERPKHSRYHQSLNNHLEEQGDLSQQQEQNVQLEQEFPKHATTLLQQQTEDLPSQNLEFNQEQNSQPLDQQQLEVQDVLPEDSKFRGSHKPINSISGYDQEQQQVDEDSLEKLSHGQHFQSSQSELTGQLDQNQEDLTQQLEDESLHGPKFSPKRPFHQQSQEQDDLAQQQVQDDLTQQQVQDDLTHQQVQDDLAHQHVRDDLTQQQVEDDSTQQQVQDDLTQQQTQDDLTQQQVEDDSTQQQVQDDLTQQIQLSHARNPKISQEQEQEQQSETNSENFIVSKKLNGQSEQQELEDQNDHTQPLKLEGELKLVKTPENDLSQQLEMVRKPEHTEQNLISEQQFENQDNSEPRSLTTESKNKPKYDQLQQQQSEENMTQQLVLSNKPKLGHTQEQEQTGRREQDLNQQLEQDETQNQQKLNNIQNIRTPENQIPNQEIQEPGNTQQQETDLTLEPNNRKIEQDQKQNDSSQKLELTDIQKSKNIKPIREQQLEPDLEPTRSQTPDQSEQQIQEQEQSSDLTNSPKDSAHKFIQVEEPKGQQLESDQTQKLELDNTQINRHTNHNLEPGQKLENEQDQQLELTGTQKPVESANSDEQQTQLQLTGTDQRNQHDGDVLPETQSPNLELTDVKPKQETKDQKKLSEQHTEDTTKHFSHNFEPHTHKITSATTETYRRPESHSDSHLDSSSSGRISTNGHSGYVAGRVTGDSYQEALRQQDALLDLLKHKIEGQPNKQGINDQKIIKKTTYVTGNMVGSSEDARFTKPYTEINRNKGNLPMNENTFSDGRIPMHGRTYNHNHEDNSGKTVRYAGNDIIRTTYHVDANSPNDSTGNIPEDFNSRQIAHDVHGNDMKVSRFTHKTVRRVLQFVNGKPVAATEYVRLEKPNGQIEESKHDIPLTEDLLRQDLSQGLPSSHTEDGSTVTNHLVHIVGSTHNIPSIENLLKQHHFQALPSEFSMNLPDGTKVTGSFGKVVTSTHGFPERRDSLRQTQSSHELPSSQLSQNMENHFQVDGSRRTEHFGQVSGNYRDNPSREDFLRQGEFAHGLPQLSQNMENHFQVDGSTRRDHFGDVLRNYHNIPSGDFLRQNDFSHGLTPGHFSQNVDYSQIGTLGSAPNNFLHSANAFDDAFGTSGFTGRARKRTSYYVNGKLVSSSESNQFIGPDGKVIEMNSGSPQSPEGTIEQQTADQHDNLTRHKSEKTSRYSVKTSRHTRTGY